MVEVEKSILILQNHNNIIKNVGERWDSHPYLALKNPFILPMVPWEPLEVSQKSVTSFKNMAQQRFERISTALEIFVLTALSRQFI